MSTDRRLARRLTRWLRGARLIERGGASAPERLQESAWARRRFLGQLGGAALLGVAAAALPACPQRRASAGGGERVVVLGAGLAGLVTLHRLVREGVGAELFEAAGGPGGRVRSAYDMPGVSAPVELGGEFIDSDHGELIALVHELGLGLYDTAPEGAPPLERVYDIGGRRVSELELLTGFVPLAHAVVEARAAMIGDGEDISYLSPSDAERFDGMSLADFIARAAPGEAARRVLEVAYLTEYGIPLEQQSALNLIMMLSDANLAESAGEDAWALYGDSDERFKVSEGNQQIAERLAARYRERIHYDMPLVAMREARGGRIDLHFANGRSVRAERVVCTLPFSILRTLDLGGVALSPLKRRAIAELGYGMNAKLCVPFSGRPWLTRGEEGSVYSDRAFQTTWDPHARRQETRGVISNYLGGEGGLRLGDGPVEARAQALAEDLEALWPGIAALRTPGARRAHWPSERWVRASYSGYLVGQWTGIGGVEGEPAGRLHFAGEHTSSSYQGFMAGAVESAGRAVREVLGRESAALVRAARRNVSRA